MRPDPVHLIHTPSSRSRPVIVIVGPTAVGKTEISIRLAERLGGEIISADSRLFYRGMDIGTAKPTVEERRAVAHHLIDVADPDQSWSLAMFQEAARAAISEIHRRGNLPFIVGGTGQYIRAVIEGWDIPRIEPDPKLRMALEAWAEEIGALGLHQRLSVLDPLAASRIDARNLRRTVRALEVILSSGREFSSQTTKGTSPYDLLQIGISRPRTQLYQRVDERIQSMFAAGFVREVQLLLEKGYSPELPTISAIGYSEIVRYLDGQISLDKACALMKRRTRIFVRRQANWFKRQDETIHWFDLEQFETLTQSVDEIENYILAWLRGV